MGQVNMVIGCCTTIERYDTLQEMGYQAIALAGKDITVMYDETFLCAARKIKEGPLTMTSLNAFCPPALRLNGPDVDYQAIRTYAEKLCARAQAMGVKYLGVGSPASRNTAEGYPRGRALAEFGRSVIEICRAAEKYQMEVLLEALASVECNCVNNTMEALDLLHSLNLPNLHLLYDIYHACLMKEPVEWIGMAAPEIRCVHVAGIHGKGHTYLSPQGMEALLPYIKMLAQCGYCGEILLEAFCGDPESGLIQSLGLLRGIRAAPN